ncbi:MAG: sulfotransferase [Paracoccaceae bacterium]|nr:sulfotransferase [Paracoccaceae bacterium]
MNQAQIAANFQHALKYFEVGQLDQALKIHKEILKFYPKIAESHYEIGRIELALSKPARALRAFEMAAKHKPNELAIWLAMANIYNRRNDPKSHKAFLKSAHKAGITGSAYSELVASLNGPKGQATNTTMKKTDIESFEKAKKYLERSNVNGAYELLSALSQKYPNDADVLNVLAASQFSRGQKDDAHKNFKSAVSLDPKNGKAWMNFGQFLLNIGDEKSAFEKLTTALNFIPDDPKLHVNLGLVFAKSLNYVDAFRALENAIKLAPKNFEALSIYASILFEVNRFSKSIETLKKLELLGGTKKSDKLLLADNYVETGRVEEAITLYDNLIALDQNWIEVREHRANCLGILGRFDEAKAAFSELITDHPKRGINYRIYSIQGKMDENDDVVSKMHLALERSDIGKEDKAEIAFALAKSQEDLKNYAQAFQLMEMGNDGFDKIRGHAFKGQIESLNNFNTSMNTVDFGVEKLQNTTDFAPIIVTGLPRSGTTLVERIISSHSRCQGAGETGQLLHVINSSGAWKQKSMKEILGADFLRLEGIGKEYESWTRENIADPMIPVDKTLSLFRYLGLIKLTMPKAKVVVLRRDPRDNLLSIYKNVFPEGAHTYAYSFENLVGYYKQFDQTMDMWRGMLGDWFYELNYEDLVAEPDNEIRKLIDFTGLDWEDACLSPQNAGGTVRTLSTAQARNAIYRTSAKSWQNYENELAPMLAALEDK